MTLRKCSAPLFISMVVAAGAALAADYPTTRPGQGGGAQDMRGQTMSQPAQGSSMQAAAARSAAGSAPVVLILSASAAENQAMANGCWARLYDTTGYGGNMLTVSGPLDVPSLSSGRIAGFEWGRNFDSVMIGPKATLMVWDDENYGDKTTTFKAGQKVADLDTKMGQLEEIKSLKLSCAR